MWIDKLLLKEVGPFENALFEFKQGTNKKLADVFLLTGPNGSGKSTALYALADAVGVTECGCGLSIKRFKSMDSQIALSSQENIIALKPGHRQNEYPKPDPFDGKSILEVIEKASLDYLWSKKHNQKSLYHNQIREYNRTMEFPKPKFSWAAFAYAGIRTVTDVQLIAIKEIKKSPFENSLSFENTADTELLAQWIANQNYKRLRAQEEGFQSQAKELSQSIRHIEKIVSDIIEDDFQFHMSYRDINVRIKRNGKILEFGVLPDGLKSIVSWVADLLMRLDRIPWENDTPILERHFLLLLDEIDIHLHPAWQRKILPIVQRAFPNAQIIATTHSPFVVASAEDAQVIYLKLNEKNDAYIDKTEASQPGMSYSAVLQSVFGIETEFDIATEKLFKEYYEQKKRILTGETSDESKLFKIADQLARRSEEVHALISMELRQYRMRLQEKNKK